MSEEGSSKQSSLGGALGTLLVNALGPWTEQIGQRWGSKAEQANIKSITEKVQQIEASENTIIDADFKISHTQGLNILDGAAAEENPDIQELWARLIVAAKSGCTGADYKPYVEVLRSLTPLSAAVLAAVAAQPDPSNGFNQSVVAIGAPKLKELNSTLNHAKDVDIISALSLLSAKGLIEGSKSTNVPSGHERAIFEAIKRMGEKSQHSIGQPDYSVLVDFARPILEMVAETQRNEDVSFERMEQVGESWVGFSASLTAFGRQFAKCVLETTG